MFATREPRSGKARMRLLFDETDFDKKPRKSMSSSSIDEKPTIKKRGRPRKHRIESSSSSPSSSSSTCEGPWSSASWLSQFEITSPVSRMTVHQRLGKLLEGSSQRLTSLSNYFGIGRAERQIAVLLRSFREMVANEDDDDHTWTRLEYCESHLPFALLNLEIAVCDIILRSIQPSFVSFALFEVLFLHSVMSPAALVRRPALLGYYQTFRLWLYDQQSVISPSSTP